MEPFKVFELISFRAVLGSKRKVKDETAVQQPYSRNTDVILRINTVYSRTSLRPSSVWIRALTVR